MTSCLSSCVDWSICLYDSLQYNITVYYNKVLFTSKWKQTCMMRMLLVGRLSGDSLWYFCYFMDIMSFVIYVFFT